jgi:hypothetical protein
MVERIIYALFYLCGLALVYWLILWVLASIGIHVPVMVANILAVMLVLVAILVLWRLFSGAVSGVRWWPRDPST